MLRIQCYLLFLMLFLTACTSNSTPIGEDGFPEFSQEELQEMVKNNPQFQNQQIKGQHSEQLLEQLELLVKKNPDDLGHNYTLAKLYYQRFSKDSLAESCQKAIPYFSKVIELNPAYEKGHAFYNRMLCYFHTKQLDNALTDINRFIEVNQGQTPVNFLSMRAEILFQQGKKEAACLDYKGALEIEKRDSLPLERAEAWTLRCPH